MRCFGCMCRHVGKDTHGFCVGRLAGDACHKKRKKVRQTRDPSAKAGQWRLVRTLKPISAASCLHKMPCRLHPTST